MHHQNHIFFQQDTQPLLRLMAHVSLLILPLLLRRLASAQTLSNMLYTSQGGRIPWFFILLIGRQELVLASTHLLVNTSQSLNLNLALFAPMSCHYRMEKAIDQRCPRCQKFRKHSAVCSSAHMAPVLAQLLGLRLSLSLWKHPHVNSLLQLLVMAFHNGLQEAQLNEKILHLHLMTVLGRWYPQHSRNNCQLVGN